MSEEKRESWKERWETAKDEYALFERKLRSQGWAWKDIPCITEWELDRRDAAEVQLAAVTKARAQFRGDWHQACIRESKLQAENASLREAIKQALSLLDFGEDDKTFALLRAALKDRP